MGSNLIELDDGLFVEVEVAEGRVREVSGSAADRVSASLEDIKPIVLQVCRPLRSMWRELNEEMTVEDVTVEFGLSFETEGNIFIARATATANLTVSITFSSEARARTD
jgi:hypothetical protein